MPNRLLMRLIYPVSADLEDGYGRSPDACAVTIRLASDVGLAGGSIEDATSDADDPIYDFQLAVDRVAPAAEAAHDCQFMLTARAENYLHDHPDLDDTIRRPQSFVEAGADVLHAPGLSNLDAIREVCASVSKPVNVLMGLKGATYSLEATGGCRSEAHQRRWRFCPRRARRFRASSA